ncbi:MAG: MBL fold metallo-hydrolase [Desulfobacterales bacterium]
MAIEKIKKHIYANTAYDGANVACIQTGGGQVLVDSPMLPKDIRHWLVFISGLEAENERYTIATHHHYDHIIGNEAMGGCLIMHETALAHMQRPGGTLREEMAPTAPGRTKKEVDFILSAPLVRPKITFEKEMILHVGEDVIRLIHVGGHAPGSICIYIENENVLFAGDNLTAGMHPYKGDADFAQWIAALNCMASHDVEIIVPGHGEVCGADELERFIEYFTRLWFMTEAMIKKGMGREEIVRKVHERLFGFFEVEAERRARAEQMFDSGTRRLYAQILSEKWHKHKAD